MQAPLWTPVPRKKGFLCLPWHSIEGLKKKWLNLVTKTTERKALYQKKKEKRKKKSSLSMMTNWNHSKRQVQLRLRHIHACNGERVTTDPAACSPQSLLYSTGATLPSEQRCLTAMSALTITWARDSLCFPHYMEIFSAFAQAKEPLMKTFAWAYSCVTE